MRGRSIGGAGRLSEAPADVSPGLKAYNIHVVLAREMRGIERLSSVVERRRLCILIGDSSGRWCVIKSNLWRGKLMELRPLRRRRRVFNREVIKSGMIHPVALRTRSSILRAHRNCWVVLCECRVPYGIYLAVFS